MAAAGSGWLRRWRSKTGGGGGWGGGMRPLKKDSADGRQDEEALGLSGCSLWRSVCRELLSLWVVMDAMKWTRTGEGEVEVASPQVAKSAQATSSSRVQQQQQHQQRQQRQRQRLATTRNHAVLLCLLG
ncbi:hypothetical protein TRV_07842 [Trichophyton verrucosum HKI 0517]|uniref:Uncharacterized protein n=1 Tax=Trichophyton verrucosum (strain HKI 0517) TaxID=663202 RepID=D4DKW8_TRIVH|nr:uncharacterized protein TRV_07842 [Trichophyton verrucosum HKI 0517]EFE37501.1 hypothetical protein TRV_07842 [Trichophyton verrucosum HKI 0517]